jgi:hypothetical protein
VRPEGAPDRERHVRQLFRVAGLPDVLLIMWGGLRERGRRVARFW